MLLHKYLAAHMFPMAFIKISSTFTQYNQRLSQFTVHLLGGYIMRAFIALEKILQIWEI